MEWKSITDSLEGKCLEDSVSIFGRLRSIRKHKERAFVDLVDYSGQVQLIIEKSENPQTYEALSTVKKGTYISVSGVLENNRKENFNIKVNRLEIVASSTLNIESPWEIDGSDPIHGNQIFSFPEIYVSNPQRAAILQIKTGFDKALHTYFQKEGFILVEPPIITDKTLYGKNNAIIADVHGEKVFLTQCATFELEPLALAFGKVYTISPAFRNESSGSKRHLAEYTHVKAEILFANIDDLKRLSGNSIHYAISKVLKSNERELTILGIDLQIDGLKPENHEHISYNDALNLAWKKGSTTKWGESLKRKDEIILTNHFGNKYVWLDFPPFVSEGFPYRRLSEDRKLSMTCDLIAPHGAGEMVGVAEKITSAEELIQNLIEKGQKENIRHYWTYIALRENGMPPHGGIGAAPERILYGLLGLDHIRLTKPWPRYPDRKIVASEKDQLNNFGSDNLKRLIEKYDLK